MQRSGVTMHFWRVLLGFHRIETLASIAFKEFFFPLFFSVALIFLQVKVSSFTPRDSVRSFLLLIFSHPAYLFSFSSSIFFSTSIIPPKEKWRSLSDSKSACTIAVSPIFFSNFSGGIARSCGCARGSRARRRHNASALKSFHSGSDPRCSFEMQSRLAAKFFSCADCRSHKRCSFCFLPFGQPPEDWSARRCSRQRDRGVRWAGVIPLTCFFVSFSADHSLEY